MDLVVDGKKVFVSSGGKPFDPALPTVVFLHGAGMDHTEWMLQARYFAHHGRGVLAVDAPGHGRTQGLGARHGLDRLGLLQDTVRLVHLPAFGKQVRQVPE